MEAKATSSIDRRGGIRGIRGKIDGRFLWNRPYSNDASVWRLSSNTLNAARDGYRHTKAKVITRTDKPPAEHIKQVGFRDNMRFKFTSNDPYRSKSKSYGHRPTLRFAATGQHTSWPENSPTRHRKKSRSGPRNHSSHTPTLLNVNDSNDNCTHTSGLERTGRRSETTD